MAGVASVNTNDVGTPAKYHRRIEDPTRLTWTCQDAQREIYVAHLIGSEDQVIANGNPGWVDTSQWEVRVDHKNRVYYVSPQFESTTWTHPSKVKRGPNPPDLQEMSNTIFETSYFSDTTRTEDGATRPRIHNDIINDYMGTAPAYYDAMRHARNHALIFFVNHLIRKSEVTDPRFALAEKETTMTNNFNELQLIDVDRFYDGNSDFKKYQKLWKPWVIRHNCKGAHIYVNTEDWSWTFQDPRIGAYGVDRDTVSGLPIHYRASFEWKLTQFRDLCHQAKGLRPIQGMPFDERRMWQPLERKWRAEGLKPPLAEPITLESTPAMFDDFYREIMWWKVPEMKRAPKLASTNPETANLQDEGTLSHDALKDLVREFTDPDFKYYLFKPVSLTHKPFFDDARDILPDGTMRKKMDTATLLEPDQPLPNRDGGGDQIADPSGLGDNYDTLILEKSNQVDEGILWATPHSTKISLFVTQANEPLPFGAARPEDQYTDEIYEELTAIDFEQTDNQLTNPGPQTAKAQQSAAKAAIKIRDENFRRKNIFTLDDRNLVTPPSAPDHCNDITINLASYFWNDDRTWREDGCYKRYQFCGRIIGMCLFHGIQIDRHFSKPLLKLLLNKESIDLHDLVDDMKTIDVVDYNTRLKPLLQKMPEVQNTARAAYFSDFIYWGADDTIDLININEQRKRINIHTILKPDPNDPSKEIEMSGSDFTEEHVDDYLRRICLHHLYGKFLPQLQHFVAGFHEVIPRAWLHLFDERELDLLLCGVESIDVHDWYANTKVQIGERVPLPTGEMSNPPIVRAHEDEWGRWFFEYLIKMTETDDNAQIKLKALFTVCCNEGIPSGGFRNLAKGVFTLVISDDRPLTEQYPAEVKYLHQDDPDPEKRKEVKMTLGTYKRDHNVLGLKTHFGKNTTCFNAFTLYRDDLVSDWTFKDFSEYMDNIVSDAINLYGIKLKNIEQGKASNVGFSIA